MATMHQHPIGALSQILQRIDRHHKAMVATLGLAHDSMSVPYYPPEETFKYHSDDVFTVGRHLMAIEIALGEVRKHLEANSDSRLSSQAD